MADLRNDRNHMFVYERDGKEVARYLVKAANLREAELHASAMYFDQNPQVDPSDPSGRLTFRVETLH